MLRRVLRVLDAQVELEVRWRGGELDRVLDEAHARLVAATMTRLRGLGWEAVAELTYAVYRERGAIDIVAWRGLERALLIVEVKSELTTVEATLRRHDEKVRLAANVVRDRFGWVPRTVSRLLVLPESRTARRRVQAGDGLIARSYPLQGVALRRWLRAPGGAGTGLLFLAGIDLSGSSRRIRRLRAEAGSRTASDELGPSAAAGG